MRRTFGEKRPCQATGAGADLDDGRLFERAGGACDARGQIEIEEKILAERFLCGEPMRGDHLAQRRQGVLHAVAPTRAPALASLPARRKAAIRLDGSALPSSGDVEGRAVIGRGAHERQAQGDVHRGIEGERLDRDERLIMVHADCDIVTGRAPPC